MTDILSNNIVRAALAVLVLGAVVYGFQSATATTTVASTAASCCPATTENVVATMGTVTEAPATVIEPTEDTTGETNSTTSD